jgi:hypothetical protein
MHRLKLVRIGRALLIRLSQPGYGVIADGCEKIISEAFCADELRAVFPDPDERFLYDVLTGTSVPHIIISIITEDIIPGPESLLK